MNASRSDPVRRVWTIGAITYLALVIVFGGFGPLFVPWAGLVMLLACLTAGHANGTVDERIVLVAALIELSIGLLSSFLVMGQSVAGSSWIYPVAFYVAALVPFATAVYVLIHTRSPRHGVDNTKARE